MKSFNEDAIFVSSLVRIGMIIIVCIVFSMVSTKNGSVKTDELKMKEVIVHSEF